MRYASAIGSTVTATPCSFINNGVGGDREESRSDFLCRCYPTYGEGWVVRTDE